MGKKLVIAEKPSVAADIARALGGFVRKGDYFESDEYLLSSAVGHLLELAVPDKFEVKKGKWSFKHLPVIPPHFELAPLEKSEQRLNLLLRLMKRRDVSGLINACDAGREGELIFRYIVQHARIKKPIERLWLQSMTPQSIRDGFNSLRADKELLPLADAAKCRSEADWLVGINGTRAMTAFNSKEGGFYLTTVGRVQTPTLAILVEREEQIRAFTPRNYWEVHARFGAKNGEYAGRWLNSGFKKDEDAERKPERLWNAAAAAKIVAACRGKKGIATEESKPTTQLSPLLFDLTSLQREANGRFGFPARMTLSLAQALYEKHKVLTYPRTDSRSLPEDYLPTVKDTLKELGDTPAFGTFAKQALKQGWVKPNKRIFDNSKISDHFAIIPTLQTPKSLSEAEAKLYDLVVKRFLAIFYPAAEYLLTTRITRVIGEPFKTEGKVLLSPGWLAVYGKEAQSTEEPMLAKVLPNEKVATEEIRVVASQTKPPARFNEATLLSAMEGAGKTIEDDELREAMREKGLGTPATRAQIIEGLIHEKYVLRDGRELTPTAKASSLMTLLHGLGVPELFSPELTAEWEFKLAQMEHGELKREQFMREIVRMTKHIVSQAKHHESDTIPGDFSVLSARCPKCGGEVHENYKKFQCQSCDFGFWKIVAGRQLEIHEDEALLTDRTVGPLEGFRSKAGRPFTAQLKLNDDYEVQFDFGDGADGGSGEAPDFSGQEPLGQCPKCGGRVFELPAAYVCERAVGPAKTCDFRSGRVILQRPIERVQMQKLLASGKTDLLPFVSARTRRPFAAYLVRQSDGKIGFEFEAKTGARGRGAKATRGATALRVLGPHPKDKQPVELHAGRYGPYVKHGGVNATLPDKDRIDAVTLGEAVALLAAKAGKTRSARPTRVGKQAPKSAHRKRAA